LVGDIFSLVWRFSAMLVAWIIYCIAKAYRPVSTAARTGRHPRMGCIHFWINLGQIDGWVGCEYKPLQSTFGGLAWANGYGIGIPSPVLSTSQSVS